MEPLALSTSDGISSLNPQAWDRLVGDGSPFLEYPFLHGLEASGCLDPATGWRPHFLTARRGSTLAGAVPLYLKYNSAGEFVFDWNWADAAHRAGIAYYPKAVAAVPYTPVTGARILVSPDDPEPDEVARNLVEYALQVADDLDLSSLHFNFIDPRERPLFEAVGLPIRRGIQYHWSNFDGTEENSAYSDFSEFLSRFRSKRRSNIRRERRKLNERGVTCRVVLGDDLSERELDLIFEYYVDTVQKHFYGRQYLNRRFFRYLLKHFARRLHVVFCDLDGEPFAGTFNLLKGDRLYGRYWGCEREIKFAHFEACIYRPVQWCIENGIDHFEPGAGGEHKFDRGFEPTLTYSAHYIRDVRLRRAVAQYVRRENRHVDMRLEKLYEESPLKDPSASRRST